MNVSTYGVKAMALKVLKQADHMLCALVNQYSVNVINVYLFL